MPKISLVFLKRSGEIHKYYKNMPSQRAESCGPYSLTPILLAYGYNSHNGYPIDEDYLSLLARTRLMKSEAEERKKVLEAVAKGELTYEEANKEHYKVLYKYDLPYTEREEESGTSVQGLIHAIDVICKDGLLTIPIPSRKGKKVLFTKRRFNKLVNYLIKLAEEIDYQIILNLRTSHLIDPTSEEYNIVSLLLNWNKPEVFSLWNWAVGHFTAVAGFMIFSNGGKNIYFILRDTYKNYGFYGYHLQPMENVRRALLRGDGREGGLLIIVPKEHYNKLLDTVKSVKGLMISDWDNGSPF